MSYDSKGSICKVFLIGRLTADVELKFLTSGTATATVTIATNTSHKGTDGKQVEETEFTKVVLWGKQAENAAQYLKKGSRVYVEGRLKTRTWEKDGTKHYMTEVQCESMQFLDTPKSETKEVPQANEVPIETGAGGENLPF